MNETREESHRLQPWECQKILSQVPFNYLTSTIIGENSRAI